MAFLLNYAVNGSLNSGSLTVQLLLLFLYLQLGSWHLVLVALPSSAVQMELRSPMSVFHGGAVKRKSDNLAADGASWEYDSNQKVNFVRFLRSPLIQGLTLNGV